MTPTHVIQAQLDAYNAQDLERFSNLFAEGCVVTDMEGRITTQGRPAIRERYRQMFAEFPKNKAKLLNRIAVGNLVIDHEHIERSPETAPFEAIAVYTVVAGQITRFALGR